MVSSKHLARAETGVGTSQPAYLPQLPADFPRIGYERLRPGGPHGLFAISPGQTKDSPPYAIVLNEDGQPVWWQRPATIAYGAQVLPDGTITWSRGFGDGYGLDPNSGAEIHTADGRLLRVMKTPGTVTDVHEFQVTKSGNTYLESYVPHRGADLRRWGGPRNAQVVLPRIVELDKHGKVIWRWSSLGRIHLRETRRWWNNSILQNPKRVDGRPTYDAVHINAIEPWGKQVVISTRHTDAIYGINRTNGRIAWKLGGVHRPQSLRVIGDPHGRVPFGGQHDVRMHGHILSVFDNGTHRGMRPRAAFYKINTKRGSARFLRALHDPNITSSHCCGSVRSFGGGWLVDWGHNHWITGFTRSGKIAFRIHLPSSTYRAIPVPPGALTAKDLARGMRTKARRAAGR